jgi:hypothetical protein
MGAPTWTNEEDRILTTSRREGRKFHEIARILAPRTPKACAARYSVMTGDPGIYMANAANDNIRRASANLRDAILAYFDRTMIETGKDMNDVIQKIVGKEPEPKTAISRHIHKTASIKRHINAVFQHSEAA